jgi:deoxyadenosine/deoxycytidine kinase
MRTWSFHLQIYFLGHRAQQHLDLAADPRSAILDRSIYEDAYIFARALHQMGNLTERDHLSYRRLFDLVVNNLPAPDLLIYLRAPIPVLMERIQHRARNIETGITPEYLNLLDSYYEDWMRIFDICPVLTISTGDLDFVNQPPHLDLVVKKIQERLAGKEEMVFQ